MRSPYRWFAQNLGALTLAFFLAVVVWVSAVVTADPNEQHTYRPVDIQIQGKDPNLLILENIPNQARLTLRAPRSIWDKLNSNPSMIKVWIDLAGMSPGQHSVPVHALVESDPTRLVQIDPERIDLTLEELQERNVPVDLIITGNLPLGYRRSLEKLEPAEVVVSGPASSVQQVAQVRARLDISGAIETINQKINLEALDKDGREVPNVTLSPREVSVQVPVSLLGGYKNAAVKVVTKGQVSPGYRLTNILVSPPTVTLFSDNPQLIESIPGYLETMPVELTNLVDDIEIPVDLNLPPGIVVVRDPKVIVQVSVAALEGSVTLTIPVEVIGIEPGLQAAVSPNEVEVIVSGPLNILEKLTPASIRAVLDLTGLGPGVYQRQVVVNQAPADVTVQTILPEIVEVTIELAPPTPTGGPTPTPTQAGP